MKRLAIILGALLLFGPSQAQMNLLTGAGGKFKAAAAASYQGPGDIVSGALAWYGLRAYSATYASPGTNPAIDIVDQSNANPLTVAILSTGALDVASIATWVTAHSVSTIKITKLYDQSGNSRNLIQSTLANMPVLVLSGLGSLPVIRHTSTTNMLTSLTVTQAQPVTIVAVAKRTTVSGALGLIFGNSTASPTVLFSVAANGASLFAGSSVSIGTAADSAFHCLQGLFNGASSTGNIDGSVSGSVNPGSGGFSANALTFNSAAFPFSGDFVEAGLWAGNFSGGNQTSTNSNVHTYWGF